MSGTPGSLKSLSYGKVLRTTSNHINSWPGDVAHIPRGSTTTSMRAVHRKPLFPRERPVATALLSETVVTWPPANRRQRTQRHAATNKSETESFLGPRNVTVAFKMGARCWPELFPTFEIHYYAKPNCPKPQKMQPNMRPTSDLRNSTLKMPELVLPNTPGPART